MNARRCVEPAIYNEDRLNEQPIPKIPIDGENLGESPLLEINRSLNELELGKNATAIANRCSEMVVNTKNLDENNQSQQSFVAVEKSADNLGGIDSSTEDIVNRNDSILVAENDDGENASGVDVEGNKKNDPFDLHEIYNDSILQVTNQLQGIETIVIDKDLTFFVGSEGFAKPLETMADFCVKQDNDSISGKIPYYNKVTNQLKLKN